MAEPTLIERVALAIETAGDDDLELENLSEAALHHAATAAIAALERHSLPGGADNSAYSTHGVVSSPPPSVWMDIDTAPKLDRVFVAGWQPRSGNTAGYWWYYEDMTDENGVPIDHPNATMWQPLPPPPQQEGK